MAKIIKIRDNYKKPIILTIRTIAEGGYFNYINNKDIYHKIIKLCIRNGISIIDYELSIKDKMSYSKQHCKYQVQF